MGYQDSWLGVRGQGTGVRVQCLLTLIMAVGLTVGCEPSAEIQATSPAPAVKESSLPQEVAPKERVPLDEPVRSGEPPKGYLGAVAGGYRSALSQIEALPIKDGLRFFYGTEGRYPKSHEEFIEKVVKVHNIPLPDVEEGYKLEYDPSDQIVYKIPIQNEPSPAAE